MSTKSASFCLSFPDATEKLQWDDALCFKVSGKMFAVLGLDNVRITFKCAPETFTELIERKDIDPSPYLGRYNWVIQHRLGRTAMGRTEGFSFASRMTWSLRN
jgi:predicted DNA-binding protein (MmcQ/YjbR family)